MIKKIFPLVFIVFVFNLFGQQTTPSVELPDFVITGTDIISVDKAQKVPPEFVSTISEEFFKPVYSPEELEVRDLSSPLKKELNIIDSPDYLRGYFDFRAGAYSLPIAKFAYLLPIENVIVETRFNGEHHRAYVDNSERYHINGGLNIIYTVDSQSEVLPGSQVKFLGDYGSSSYKFFASNNPLKRTLNQGNFSLGFSNQVSRLFLFDLSVSDELSSINEEDYLENILSFKAFSRVNFSSFNIAVNANYNKQFLSINNTPIGTPNSDVDDFFSIRPTAGINISNSLKVSAGLTYSASGPRSYTAPYASIGLNLNKNLSLFGEYSPQAEFINSGKLLKINRYFDPQNFYNFFVRKRNAFTAAVKYEYDKYYQINAGVRFFNSPEYPFFRDSIQVGKFSLSSANTEGLTLFSDLFFHLGPFGMLYGMVEWNQTKDNFDKIIPYHPQTRAAITYGYNFDFGLNSEIKFSYASKTYADIANTISQPGYFDVGLNFAMLIVNNFFITLRFDNLFSDDIYYWRGYKETPLDVMGGFIYKW